MRRVQLKVADPGVDPGDILACRSPDCDFGANLRVRFEPKRGKLD